MRTACSSTARILHDLSVQNRALFYSKRQECARLEIEKPMKNHVSKALAKGDVSLDLGRSVRSTGPFSFLISVAWAELRALPVMHCTDFAHLFGGAQ